MAWLQVKPVHIWMCAQAMSHGVVPVTVVLDVVSVVVVVPVPVLTVVVVVCPPAPVLPELLSLTLPPQPANQAMVTPSDAAIPQA
jgi:hypothetical protein